MFDEEPCLDSSRFARASSYSLLKFSRSSRSQTKPQPCIGQHNSIGNISLMVRPYPTRFTTSMAPRVHLAFDMLTHGQSADPRLCRAHWAHAICRWSRPRQYKSWNTIGLHMGLQKPLSLAISHQMQPSSSTYCSHSCSRPSRRNQSKASEKSKDHNNARSMQLQPSDFGPTTPSWTVCPTKAIWKYLPYACESFDPSTICWLCDRVPHDASNRWSSTIYWIHVWRFGWPAWGERGARC